MAIAPGAAPPRPGAIDALIQGVERSKTHTAGLTSQLVVRAGSALDEATRLGLGVVSIADARYPEALRQIADPPVVLWVRGEAGCLDASPMVALVGSRSATPEGLVTARRLARSLSEAGITVVSGLARGIDGAAHRGALQGTTPTIAVVGCGLDRVYPVAHGALAAEISQRGALIAEYPPGTPPLPRHFPLRNRIISGLVRAVVVVEASDRSGSLITARTALEQGRDVLAVPGGIASGLHRGCHALIKDGARLVETVDDILDEIQFQPTRRPERVERVKCFEDSWLEPLMPVGHPNTLDDLSARSGRSLAEVMTELLRLEMSGMVSRLPAGRFIRLD